MREILGGLTLVVLAFSLNGCFKDDEQYDAFDQLQTDLEIIRDYFDRKNIVDAVFDSAYGLYYKVHDQGSGYKAARTGTVQVIYEGYVLEGDKFTFGGNPNLPREYVFASEFPEGITVGFDVGLSNLVAGDSATLWVPSPYGYQNKSYGLAVKPNDILEYRVKFVGIKLLESELISIDQYIADKGFDVTIDPEYGTRYVVHSEGEGIRVPKTGDQIITHYTGQLINGLQFDSSWGSLIPFEYRYNNNDVVIGFDLGFRYLTVGDSATFFIPSTYGYKDRAQGSIPANSVLVFGVKFLNLIETN